MITPVTEVTAMPTVSRRVNTVERVHNVGDGQHKVIATTYIVTTYDDKGRLVYTTNTSQVSYTV